MADSNGQPAVYGNGDGQEAARVGIVFAVLAAVLVALRLSTRFIILRSPGWDDVFVSIGLALSIVLAALAAIQVKYGLGEPQKDLPDDIVRHNLKLLYVFIILYYTGLLFVKVSIIVQYLRIFVSKRMRITCWIVLAAVTAYSLSTIFGAAFTCVPVRFFWDRSVDGEHYCVNQKALWFSNASLNIVTDLVVLICPMPALKSLQLPKRQKIGVMMVFALGGVTVVMSILRLHALYELSISTDWTKDNVGAAMWSMVELNTGIICACLPILKPLIARFFPKLLGSAGYSSRGFQGSTMNPYSARMSKHARTLMSHNSFYLADTKTGRENDIRGSSDNAISPVGENGRICGNNDGEIQVTTTVEVAHQDDRSATGVETRGSANTSERSLVLPPTQQR